MNVFKGTYKGRSYEVNEDLNLQIDKGPMLAESEKELLRSAAIGHFKHRQTRNGQFVRPQAKR